jgi:hypothetical protein
VCGRAFSRRRIFHTVPRPHTRYFLEKAHEPQPGWPPGAFASHHLQTSNASLS